MSRVWRTIKGYIFWTYERGSFHYDVMVSLILIFIFLAPQFINFKDKPTEHVPHQTGIFFATEGDNIVYNVDVSVIDAQDEGMVRTNLLNVIRPISGRVSITKLDRVNDSSGHIVAYRAVVHKEGPR